MLYSEFKKMVQDKYNGYYDHDGFYGAECADLAKGVCQFVLGAPIGAFGNPGGKALNGWENKNRTFNEELYERIDRTATPQQCDIVIFNEKLSPWGHIGCIESASNNKEIKVYDALGNGEKVGGEKPAMVRTYKTTNVLGYWRRKGYVPENLVAITPIEKRWNEISVMPGFVKGYVDYSDNKPITGGDARRLLDIERFTYKK